MSYIPAALAIDPTAFISTILAGIVGSLTLIIVLLVLSCGSNVLQSRSNRT
jgi:hypothetical protein